MVWLFFLHYTSLCISCDKNLEEFLMLCFMLWTSCCSFLSIKIYVCTWVDLLFVNTYWNINPPFGRWTKWNRTSTTIRISSIEFNQFHLVEWPCQSWHQYGTWWRCHRKISITSLEWGNLYSDISFVVWENIHHNHLM